MVRVVADERQKVHDVAAVFEIERALTTQVGALELEGDAPGQRHRDGAATADRLVPLQPIDGDDPYLVADLAELAAGTHARRLP